MQRDRVIKWCNKLKNSIEREEPLQVKLTIRKNPIDSNRSNTETIKRWLYNAKEIIKKVEKTLRNNI